MQFYISKRKVKYFKSLRVPKTWCLLIQRESEGTFREDEGQSSEQLPWQQLSHMVAETLHVQPYLCAVRLLCADSQMQSSAELRDDQHHLKQHAQKMSANGAAW